jgi:hypothetical protein
MNNSFVVPSRRRSGGLWLMWNDDLQVSVHASNFHTILATVVHTLNNIRFGLVCIYGDPYHCNTIVLYGRRLLLLCMIITTFQCYV